jgi:similar to stage IV sporulation protein
MFTINFARTMRGYVEFSAVNGSMERLLNLIARNKLSLWDLRKKDEVFYGVTLAADYKKIARLSRKTGVKTKAGKRHGLPFLLRKYRKRLGVTIGIIVFILFIVIMQNFIWTIEVQGNKDIKTETVLEIMDELGVHKGSFKPLLDFKKIEQSAKMKFGDISWLAINQNGSKVIVELRESVKAPDIVDSNSPCNIVAKKAGQIKTLRIFSGQAVVGKNDTVVEGDLIVSGIVEDPAGNTTLKHASAEVIAETFFEKEFKTKLEYEKKEYLEKTNKRYLLDLFGLKMPLYVATKKKGNFDINSSYKELNAFGISFPFGIYTNEYKPYQMTKVSLTDDEAKEMLLKQADEYEKKEFSKTKILDKKTDTKLSNDEYVLKISYKCQEDIAIKEEILTNKQKN